MVEPVEEKQISKWADMSLENVDISNYKINFKYADKGEGYTTKVVFLTAEGSKKSNGEKTKCNLVLKVSKLFKPVGRDEMEDLFKKESLVYNKVFPELKKFVGENSIIDFFNSVPQFYRTISDGGREILVLGNLRASGYRPHDRLQPMNLHHVKLILRKYAQFHAISFAFQDQNPRGFKNGFSNYENTYKLVASGVFGEICHHKVKRVRNVIHEADENLANKIDEFLDRGILNILKEKVDESVESVITHGDCWNSNFLFQYDEDTTHPTQVAILDWQVSSFHSLCIDLSYFLFAVSSTENASKFEDLLKFYHNNLSEAIKQLGSDPEKLFPFSKFHDQWKKFSFVGWLFAMSFLDNFMCDQDSVIDFEDMSNSEEVIHAMTSINVKNPELYLERLMAVSKYYFNLIGK